MFCLFCIYLTVFVNADSSNDLKEVLEGVEYHDQLIRNFHVSYTSKDLLRGKNGRADRIRERNGECFYSDGMIVATEVIPPEPMDGEPGELTTKMTRKFVFDKERLMEVAFYHPEEDSESWAEVFFYPQNQYRYLFLHRYSPLFSTTINLLQLNDFAKHYSVESVHPKGYETVNTNLCFRISFKHFERETEVLINLDKGYRIQEVQIIAEEGLNTQLERHSIGALRKIEWMRYKDQIWYPVKTYLESYVINNRTKAKTVQFWEEIEFKNFEANIDIAEDVFLTIPPPDAILIKHY